MSVLNSNKSVKDANVEDTVVAVRGYLSLYLSAYCVLMCVSPRPPGAQLQVRSLVFLDQQVRLTGFSGGTGTDGKERREEERTGEEKKREWRRKCGFSEGTVTYSQPAE